MRTTRVRLAEERLKEIEERYIRQPTGEPRFYPVRISPKDIDLIADLVVERMKK